MDMLNSACMFETLKTFTFVNYWWLTQGDEKGRRGKELCCFAV